PQDGEVVNGPRLPDGRVRLRITLELGSSDLLQNSNNPRFDDAIARRRQDEAEMVRRLYTTSRATEIFTVDEESDPVESHPAMIELRRWIARVERGEALLDRNLLAGLESVRQALFTEAYGPGPEDERQYLLAVCEAYTTLLREFVSREAR
ncbi:MAG: hypothetical protein KDA25_02125, partial [Phycisphaerales bacterium]|nr:hypothetical protein [Phycisphaerales bacterium]